MVLLKLSFGFCVFPCVQRSKSSSLVKSINTGFMTFMELNGTASGIKWSCLFSISSALALLYLHQDLGPVGQRWWHG